MQKLEKVLRDNPKLCREIEELGDIRGDVHVLIKEARMLYCDAVYHLNGKIMEAEVE